MENTIKYETFADDSQNQSIAELLNVTNDEDDDDPPAVVVVVVVAWRLAAAAEEWSQLRHRDAGVTQEHLRSVSAR